MVHVAHVPLVIRRHARDRALAAPASAEDVARLLLRKALEATGELAVCEALHLQRSRRLSRLQRTRVVRVSYAAATNDASGSLHSGRMLRQVDRKSRKSRDKKSEEEETTHVALHRLDGVELREAGGEDGVSECWAVVDVGTAIRSVLHHGVAHLWTHSTLSADQTWLTY